MIYLERERESSICVPVVPYKYRKYYDDDDDDDLVLVNQSF